MKKNLTAMFLLLSFMIANSQGHVHESDPLNKTFITKTKRTANMQVQQQLRNASAWQSFLSKHAGWGVTFNEDNALPQRAYGNAIHTGYTGTASEIAMQFMSNDLAAFALPINELELRSSVSNTRFNYLHFIQRHKGLEVLWSDAYIKMLADNSIITFGLDVFPKINVDVIPTLTPAQIEVIAKKDMVYPVVNYTADASLYILPVPFVGSYEFKLVYKSTVSTMSEYKVPSRYLTLIDAHSGQILYRANEVCHANMDVHVKGTYYPTHNYNPTQFLPLANMRVNVGGTNYNTDSIGYLGLSNTAAINATFYLEGLWSTTRTNGVVPQFTQQITPGVNNISFDNNSNDKEMSAYAAVNVVHDYCKSKFPNFTGMDFSLPTNIDVTGSCNAFYDGSSINFFDAGGGCNATSTVTDVVYHEYGHGINDKYYQSIGTTFGNAAMNEGYADIWALGITDSPILGIGFFTNNPQGYVRRYDVNKKVYPQDLVGESHADGEIIAGAWWDLGLNINDRQLAMDLFKQTFDAGLTGPDGSEGVLYTEILIEAITVDDNDGNLNNGTPHLNQILDAFADHGIYLIQNVNFSHTELKNNVGWSPITVDATLSYTSQFPWYGLKGVTGYYRINNQTTWTPFSMTNNGGNNYQGQIPGQPGGTLVAYYLVAEDSSGSAVSVLPTAANETNPNIPYYILVGYTQLSNEDFDNLQGNWTIGLPNDDAISGMWEVAVPIGTYNTNGTPVQPDNQVTPGGIACAITQADPGTGIGSFDIDGGVTTMISPVYDLTQYTNPAFSYYRWYVNDAGANPGKDFWDVSISNDGVTYVPIEYTNVADNSWRRYAFRPLDYITASNNVTIKFVASDIPDPNLNPTGSLVEAALDELVIWDGPPLSVNEVSTQANLAVSPNPAHNILQVSWLQTSTAAVTMTIYDVAGKVISTSTLTTNAGKNKQTLDISSLESGMYQVVISNEKIFGAKKFTVMH